MRFSLKTFREDVQYHDQMYGQSWCGGCTASISNVWPECDRGTLFHQPSHSSYFLIVELCFSRNRIDDRFFLSIQGYEASRELHGRALRPWWVQTHMDACCCFSCIACLFYIYQTCKFFNSHDIHFGTTENSFLQKCVSVNKIIMRLVKLCM